MSVGVGGAVTKLIFHGIIQFMLVLPLSPVAGAIYCQISALLQSRQDQVPGGQPKASEEEEPLLRRSGTMPPV
jgi:hypothetical protein